MKTLQEKYIAVNENRFTKAQFLRDARMTLPTLVTQYNDYTSAVQILKNKGILTEAITKKSEPVRRPVEITNKKDMYSFEQVQRGLMYELEAAGVCDTPTRDEYYKCEAKVLKNLEKDPLYYLHKVADVKKPAKNRGDIMSQVTAKNLVDKINGMVKVTMTKQDLYELKNQLKPLIKRLLESDQEIVEDLDYPGNPNEYFDDEEIEEAVALKDPVGNIQYVKNDSEASAIEKQARDKGVRLTKTRM